MNDYRDGIAEKGGRGVMRCGFVCIENEPFDLGCWVKSSWPLDLVLGIQWPIRRRYDQSWTVWICLSPTCTVKIMLVV